MEKILPVFSRIDRTFDESRTGDYGLVLQVTGRSCAFSVFDQTRETYIALESYDIPLSGLVSQGHWLKNPFNSVHTIIENNRSTLIPEVLFVESEKESYLEFSMEPIDDEMIRFDKLNGIEAVNVFGISSSLYEEIIAGFPDAKICHLSSFMIDTIWRNFKHRITEKRIFVFLRQADLNMLIFDKKQLVYSNAFHIRTPEDVVYFVIFVMEQLNLNPEEIPVTLLGNINRDSPEFDLLFRYIRNLDFAPRNEDLHRSHVFHDVPDHAWYSLLNPVMCGS